MKRAFSCCGEIYQGIGRSHHVTTTAARLTLASRWAPAAVLLSQTRERSKFSGNVVDPHSYLRRKIRVLKHQNGGKKPLMSNERKQKAMRLPLLVTSLNQMISTTIPLERFARAPLHTKLGLKQRWEAMKETPSVIYSGGIIKRRLKKVDPFIPREFARRAKDQFIEVNMALQNKDRAKLRELTTENATEELNKEFLNKPFTWKFVEELERPRVISARVAPFNTKDNLFGQLVVRIKSKQLLAVYSPSGKLVMGDPHRPKEVIDYVVFERHLVDPERTSWKVARKLPPQRPWQEIEEEEERNTRPSIAAATATQKAIQ